VWTMKWMDGYSHNTARACGLRGKFELVTRSAAGDYGIRRIQFRNGTTADFVNFILQTRAEERVLEHNDASDAVSADAL
jgi:hypothetical protein